MADTPRSKRRGGAAQTADSPDDVSAPLESGLYLLATPIGAAGDITLRGLDALRRADLLACEDTRVLRRLLDIHDVALRGRPLVAYHDHNAAEVRPRLLERAQEGAVVYASDAGTPLIADPGFRLVEEARARDIPVRALPGPSAVLAALSVAGLPTDRFCFGGFPPPKQGARRRWLEDWRAAPGTLVFYESPRRLAATLSDMAEVLGDRSGAVARELTKKFEEVRRGPLAELAAHYASAGPPKGEVVVLAGPAPAAGPADETDIDAALREALGEMSAKDAARHVADRLSAPRRMVYARAVALSREERE